MVALPGASTKRSRNVSSAAPLLLPSRGGDGGEARVGDYGLLVSELGQLDQGRAGLLRHRHRTKSLANPTRGGRLTSYRQMLCWRSLMGRPRGFATCHPSVPKWVLLEWRGDVYVACHARSIGATFGLSTSYGNGLTIVERPQKHVVQFPGRSQSTGSRNWDRFVLRRFSPSSLSQAVK